MAEGPAEDARKSNRTLLRKAGLRATSARLEVLSLLQKLGRPVSHSEVCEALDAKEIDRATLYRNLTDLAEAGIVRRNDFGDHIWRFELASHHAHSEPDGSHVHFVCTTCGDVACLPHDTVVVRPKRNLPKSLKGDLQISISGVCDTCQ